MTTALHIARSGTAAAVLLLAALPAFGQDESGDAPLSLDAINSAALEGVATMPLEEIESADGPDPKVIRLQILLDRAGASPGVIDGYDGENVRKAIAALESMEGMEVDGVADADLLDVLDDGEAVVARHEISEADLEDVLGDPLPDDYSELAEMSFLGYASAAEALAEQFHMDQDLLETLNPEAQFTAGEEILVASPGPAREGEVARIEADRDTAQVRAFDSEGTLLAAYPATVGSESNPSPSGTHEVAAIAAAPNYTYDPETFTQGDNTSRLVLPPGPNNPVGSTWIDLSEPGYGIHGTPEPSEIDKTASHGCVRLTNWDAEELAGMVSQGVTVSFVSN